MRLFLILLMVAGAAQASDTQKVDLTHSIKNNKEIVIGNIPDNRVIVIDSVIRQGTLKKATEILKGLPKNTQYYVMIDSPGGSVYEGMAFIREMQTALLLKNNKSICIVNGMAASMAAIITSYCNEAYIDKLLGSLMYHQIAFSVRGQVKQVKDLVEFIERQARIIETDLAGQMGIPLKSYKELTQYEYWLTSRDAVTGGYVNGYAKAYTFKKPEAAAPNIFQQIFGR